MLSNQFQELSPRCPKIYLSSLLKYTLCLLTCSFPSHHHFIQKHIEQGEVVFQYISTKEMLVDIFIKALSLSKLYPMKSLLNFEQGQVFCLLHNILLGGSIEVCAVLTHLFIPISSLLFIPSFHMLSFHTSVIFLIISIVTYVNRCIFKQSVFILQLDCTRASFFSLGSRYVLSKSHCSIYLVSFPLVLVTLKYICSFISKSLCFLSHQSLTEQSKLNAFISKNLYMEQIGPSKSPIAIPVFFIKKKDSFLQLL